MNRTTAILTCLLLAACHRHHPPHDAGAAVAKDLRPGLTFTRWGKSTELFLEMPALVRGMDSPCAAHVTRLSDGAAVAAGTVMVLLSEGGPAERFSADKAVEAGIFRPIARPAQATRRKLRVEVRTGTLNDMHDLGEVTVFDSVEAAAAVKEPEPSGGGTIAFRKEQQWSLGLTTAAVASVALRPALTVSGTLRARHGAEADMRAPFAGRVTRAGARFPKIGASVRAGQVLARLVPRPETADRASLDLAVTLAGIERRHAAETLQRTKALFGEGALPEKRLVEATHALEQANATVAAAEKRREQLRQLPRTRGAAAEGVLTLRAPISGVVVAVDVAPDGFAEAGAALLRIVHLQPIWAEARVPAADASRLAEVRGASLAIEGFPQALELGHEAIAGRSHQVDPVSRTLALWFTVDNAKRQLAPGGARKDQFPLGASVHVRLFLDEPVTSLAIPVSALIDDNGLTVAFVQVGGESFERRILSTTLRDGDLVGVSAGLRAGERVVTRGAWTVKLAASAGSAPAHGHAH